MQLTDRGNPPPDFEDIPLDDADELEGVDFEALKARTLSVVRQKPASVRGVVTRRTRVIWALGLLIPVAIFVSVGALRVGDRSLTLYAGTAVGTLLVAIVAAWVVLGRGGQMLGRPKLWLSVAAISTPLSFLIWKMAWSYLHSGAHVWPERVGLRCLSLSLGLALFPLLALAITRRGLEPRHPMTLGAAFGVISGLYAGVLVDLWCPVGHITHVLLGHILPMGILGLVGIGIGWKVLAVDTK